MQRNYQTDFSNSVTNQELINQTAFHESGHAASIYLGNRRKELPPVFFQIKISCQEDRQRYAKVIDGRLIQSLPVAGLDGFQELSKQELSNYQTAYQADVINLLVGPLAEAKYISLRDDEDFNFNLLNIHALNYYGGSSDIKKAYHYLEYFIASETEREAVMLELFLQAYLFIKDAGNWAAILNLAHYILKSKSDVISCEQAVDILEPIQPSR